MDTEDKEDLENLENASTYYFQSEKSIKDTLKKVIEDRRKKFPKEDISLGEKELKN